MQTEKKGQKALDRDSVFSIGLLIARLTGAPEIRHRKLRRTEQSAQLAKTRGSVA
jgi:hypothetical protein